MTARTVRELAVWQLCEELRLTVVAATAAGVAARNARFCDQIRDAAVDAVADVAEGYARFRPKVFAQFLDYAISSLGEVETRARDGHSRNYFDNETCSQILRLTARAESAARALRRYLWTLPDRDRPRARPLPRRKARRGRDQEG